MKETSLNSVVAYLTIEVCRKHLFSKTSVVQLNSDQHGINKNQSYVLVITSCPVF